MENVKIFLTVWIIRSDSLNTWRFVVSARTAWTMGKENFPSVRSSQYPLLSEYCESDDEPSSIG